MVEFLDLPDGHTRRRTCIAACCAQLKAFLIELGRDFCFVGSEYPVQVGGRDFALDLLFFHRGLNCLVAIELKVDRFEPEHLGKLGFYLEALDRDVRKPHENPAIGVAALRLQGQRGGRICPQPHALARADCRVPDPTA